MDDLSTELKTQRETLGLSIQDLFRRTRINPDFLEALEEGNYDVLPEAYIKLFLKRYAQELKLDPDDIIREFEKLRWKAKTSTEPVPVRRSEGTPGWMIGGGAVLALGIVAAIVVLQTDPTPTAQTFTVQTPPAQPTMTNSRPAVSRPAIQESSPPAHVERTPVASPAPSDSPSSVTSVAADDEPLTTTSASILDQSSTNGIGTTDEEMILSETPVASPEQIPIESPEILTPQTSASTEVSTETERAAPLAAGIEADTIAIRIGDTAAPETTQDITTDDPQDEAQGERVVSGYSLNFRQELLATTRGLSLSVVGREPTIISVISDGEQIFDGRVDAGRKISWEAGDRFQIEIQNGSSVQLELQDVPLPRVGAGGLKVRLFISRSSIWVEEIASPDLASSPSSTP